MARGAGVCQADKWRKRKQEGKSRTYVEAEQIVLWFWGRETEGGKEIIVCLIRLACLFFLRKEVVVCFMD